MYWHYATMHICMYFLALCQCAKHPQTINKNAHKTKTRKMCRHKNEYKIALILIELQASFWLPFCLTNYNDDEWSAPALFDVCE